MNTEIYQLVKHLDHSGLEDLPYAERRILLWQRAVQEWNQTHSPADTTLDDVYSAFKNKWPQIYGAAPFNGTLYLSFSYVDYIFAADKDGQLCGGVWRRSEERPSQPVNMSAELIADLASLLRIVPESVEDWEEDEETIQKEQEWICYYNPDDWCGDLQSQLYLHLESLAKSQYMLGLFEDCAITLGRAIQYMECDRSNPSQLVKDVSQDNLARYIFRKVIILGEIRTLLAETYSYLFYPYDAECCYQLALENLSILERDSMFEFAFSDSSNTEKLIVGQEKRCIYLNCAWSYAMFYIKSNRVSDAIEILHKAEKVARSMNKSDNGKWSEKLKSITKKIKELKASEYNHE